ncbi:ARPP-2 domain-containing protein [Nonomuraea salmonea]|uniref:ARPP-2 domain-containing protein n=1 Tax=Nonomuraea salmonea TaxID=46181 RepID=UPI002FEA8559
MIDLTGLETRPAQTWGALRLVPLVRRTPIEDLRLHAKVYGDEPTVVALPDRSLYTAYVPHAFVASWTGDGTPAAAYGTQLGQPLRHVPIRIRRRMARRADGNRLRFLPLHLAMEGFLALCFGGPELAWEEWSRESLRHGLSPRIEEAYSGAEVRGLEDALKVFEIHPGQCGLLLYAGDTLASAFVVPHPEDYRALHPTLVRDMYGDLIHEYALFFPARDFTGTLDAAAISSLADLRAAAVRVEREWAGFHDSVMAAGLLRAPRAGAGGVPDGPVHAEPVPARVRAQGREPHRRDDQRRRGAYGVSEDVPAVGGAGQARPPAERAGRARLAHGRDRRRAGRQRAIAGDAAAAGRVRAPAAAGRAGRLPQGAQ